MSRLGPLAATLVAVAMTLALALNGQASAVASRAAAPPDAGIAFPLRTSGPSIVDAKGHSVKLGFVNWYGAESQDYVVGGLKYQPINTIISEIVKLYRTRNAICLPYDVRWR